MIEGLCRTKLPLWERNSFILEYLDGGFQGDVYKATHNESKEVFVLKELKENDEENRMMFLEEIYMLAKLNHPNVIKCKGLIIEEDYICYLTEFIEGGTLQELLMHQDALQLSWETFLNITLDVARGMAYLHHQGIIHRDLNSKNILVREIYKKRYMAFIIDLGLSYQKCDENLLVENIPYGPVGSPYHIAPELFHDEPCSHLTDVFSYGIILCEIISGCPGADPEDLPRTNDFGLNVEEFSEMSSDCPTEYLNLAVTCCQVNPKLRPNFVDIVKILDIMIDRYEELTSSSNIAIDPYEGQSLTSNVISADNVYDGDENFDYVIEESVLCTCGKTKGIHSDISIVADTNFPPTDSFKRYGEVYRNSSRRFMRKYVSRCSICGGRRLCIEEIEGNKLSSIPFAVPHAITEHPIIIERCEDKSHIDEGEPQVTNDVIKISQKINIVSNGCLNAPSKEKGLPGISENLEHTPLHPAGAFLKQDRTLLCSKTSKLAENTPGRLPTFFLRLLRRRKSHQTYAINSDEHTLSFKSYSSYSHKEFQQHSISINNTRSKTDSSSKSCSHLRVKLSPRDHGQQYPQKCSSGSPSQQLQRSPRERTHKWSFSEFMKKRKSASLSDLLAEQNISGRSECSKNVSSMLNDDRVEL